MLAALPATEKNSVRQTMQSRFRCASLGGQLEVTAEALAVRGRV